MKKLIWLMLLCMPFSGHSQFINGVFLDTGMVKICQGVHWTEGLSWEQVKEKAKSENKYIFVDAFATWCAPCKKMEKEIYPTKEIGELMNSSFISVKLQMDKTKNDNQFIKQWYPIVKQFNSDYNIDGYPTFLFLDADGKLLYKEGGFHDVSSFSEIIKISLTDPESRYKASIQAFKKGQLSFSLMPMIARQAWKKKDQETSIAIVKAFKEKYVDGLSDDDAFSKENLSLLAEFSYELLNSRDRYFKFFYDHSEVPDSTINQFFPEQGVERARTVVLAVIGREINDKIYKNGKPIQRPRPNWKDIHKSVIYRYGKLYYDIFFPETEISYYDDTKDWKEFVRYVNKKIRKNKPQRGGHEFGRQFGDEWTINYYAWRIFLKCNDRYLLEKALKWADMAIQLEEKPGLKANYIDTKSNLLYKIGKKVEAIELEERALEFGKDYEPSYQSIKEVIEKMKAGEPTWE